ncbi:MAG: CDC48 family AAA ATPase [Nanoarchaeota archaeon]|nr:CDC48 family AAA ATPase [Nanoarchaeota archaeon]
MEEKKIMLSVQESPQVDVGKGVARISTSIMAALGLKPREIIIINGKAKRKAAAQVMNALLEDEDKNIIRIDGTFRFNLGVSLDEKVDVEKAKSEPALEIELSPLEEISPIAQIKTDKGMQQIPIKPILVQFIKTRLINMPFIKNNKLSIDVMGRAFQFGVKNVSPKGVVTLENDTKLIITDELFKENDLKIPDITYEDIGGLDEEIDQIREMIELPMKHPEVFERLGIGAPKGLLLSGSPGTGKTLLAKAVASETESSFYSIAGPEIMSKFYGESEKQLRNIFEQAEKNAPSIIFIDEIDAIAPKREEVTGEVERRVVAQLLTSLDGLKSRGQVVVIAATNRPDYLDPALRRPGRFDREITINAPNEKSRKEILQIHTRGMPLSENVDMDKLAEMTIAYTGADLEALCKEAAIKSLKNYLPSLKHIDEKVPENVLEKIVVRMDHFMSAFNKVEPSAMREVLITKPKTRWEDIGGLEDVKKKLIEAINWPLEEPELFTKAGITPPKGILLHGPPGTGKTLLAKAVANESNANFIAVKGPELVSKWVGESEKHVRQIFKKARQVAPSIIFFDEFDSISQVRGLSSGNDSTERMVNQLLTELDGIEELGKVVVIAATNRPDLIDPGLLRPGRIDIKLEISLPDKQSRLEIFRVHTKNMPLDKKINLEDYVQKTEGMSGAEIEAICREAGMESIRESKNTKSEIKIKRNHFDAAIEIVKASLSRKSVSEMNKDRSYIQ